MAKTTKTAKTPKASKTPLPVIEAAIEAATETVEIENHKFEAVEIETVYEFGCPFCGANDSHLTPAGPDGTFLGDAINYCHACDKAHNRFSKEEFKLRATTGKRTNINPQPEIDAKKKALEAVGGELSYDRKSRLWTVSLPGRATVHMTGKDFAAFTAKTIVMAA